MNRRLTLAAACATAATALAACGTQPTDGSAAPAAPGSTQAPGTSGSAPATTTHTPTPTPDATKVQPGTNHNAEAAAYAYEAKDVQAWLKEGTKAPNYPDHKIVFLTFDDGPTTNITPKDLDALKKADVHATFYYITKQLGPETAPIAHRAIAEGNAVDIHSWSHDYNYLYPGRSGSADHIMADYAKSQKAMEDTFGPDFKNHGFRYPGGHMSWKNLGPADEALANEGVYWIDWNTMTGDAEPKKTQPTTVDGMVQMVQSGIASDSAHNPNVAVVLMHDAADKKLTNESLPSVIAKLKSEGYEFGVID